MNVKRVIIIGAGPMGLFAAHAAAKRGFDVTVLERGRIGEHLLSWGSTRFFSPLGMNIPADLREVLPTLPPAEALLTGPEMVDKVLLPLSRLSTLRDCVHSQTKVIAVGRAGFTRRDFPGHPVRAERPFQVIAATANGTEKRLEADLVFDASGVYGNPTWMGQGGLPALGERDLSPHIVRRLAEVEALAAVSSGHASGAKVDGKGARAEAVAEARSAEGSLRPGAGSRSKRILLVGHGHSAAHALLVLAAAARGAAASEAMPAQGRNGAGTALGNVEMTVTLAIRSRHRRPFQETASDPLPERARTVSAANELAANPPSFLRVLRGQSVTALERIRTSEKSEVGLKAAFSDGTTEEFDHIMAFTGYRPELSFLSELGLELSPATEGLGRLHKILCGAVDCLSVPVPAPADLATGEPGFFMVGSKSYGRSSAFLLRDGIRHLEMMLKQIP